MIRDRRSWSCHRRTHWWAICSGVCASRSSRPSVTSRPSAPSGRGDDRHAMRGCFQNLDAGASACPQRHDSNCGLPVIRGNAVHGASDGDAPSGPERQHAVSRTVTDDQYLHGTLAGPMNARQNDIGELQRGVLVRVIVHRAYKQNRQCLVPPRRHNRRHCDRIGKDKGSTSVHSPQDDCIITAADEHAIKAP